jgi:hypothetical protein
LGGRAGRGEELLLQRLTRRRVELIVRGRAIGCKERRGRRA